MSVKIIIAEDEHIVAKDIENKLKKLGYNIPAVVSSGVDVIDKATEYLPDLVLMDIKLEGDIDGIEAAQHLRSKLNIPVVYLTAYADDSTLSRVMETEPYGYILKPFILKELKSNIEIALYKSKMEIKLLEREKWLHTILDSIGDAVIVANEKAQIKFMNPIAKTLTEWSDAETESLELSQVFDIQSPEENNLCEKLVEKLLRKETVTTLNSDITLKTKSGNTVPISNSIAPIMNEQQDVAGIVIVFQNIEEKKNIEEYMLKSQKIESLAVLAGGLAHNFNNILTTILGNISLARAYSNPKERAFKNLTQAEESSVIARNLIYQLATFSTGGPPEDKVLTPIGNIIKDAADYSLLGSDITYKLNVPGDNIVDPTKNHITINNNNETLNLLPPVNADPERLRQAICNIIINSKESMPRGGVINIEAKVIRTDENPALTAQNGKHTNYIKISVQDEGIGISESHIPKVFDPFFSTKQTGTGLGLAVSYSIIKNHDGKIEIESILAKGTTVNIYVPVAGYSIMPKKPGTSEEVIAGSGKILIMDDDRSIREILKDMLLHLGYSVESTKHGNEAITVYVDAYKSDEPFDVVILDLTVKGNLGGKDTVGKLLEMNPEAKVIVSSGYSDDSVIMDYKKYGFVGCITKPYKLQELSKVVSNIIKSA